MALLLLKTLFFRQPSSTSYTLLPSFGHNGDSRDTLSSDSEPSDRYLEKERSQENPTSRFKVDPRIISDATIGLSDGLTVPFALTAGLSALGDTNLVIYGGLAELIAGGISMGLGGYLGAMSEACVSHPYPPSFFPSSSLLPATTPPPNTIQPSSQAYAAALSETRELIAHDSDQTTSLIKSTFSSYKLSDQILDSLATQLLASGAANTEDFLMRFHHQVPESGATASRAYVSALTIAAGYFFGGMVPLTPYFLAGTNRVAFLWSVGVVAIALFVFGYVKTLLVGEGKKAVCVRAGLQMVVLGGVAAGAAMGCVMAIGG